MSTQPAALKTLLVEDERMFSEMLARSINDLSGLDLAARAFSVSEAVALCEQQPPDLVILDLALPDGSGAEVLGALQRLNINPHVLVLSAHAEDFVPAPDVAHMIVAVISKGEAHAELSRHLRAIIQQHNPGFEDEQNLINRLTAREMDIFTLLGEGLTNREIAKRLSRSAATVATHRKMIAVKLRCSGAALMAVATRHRIHSGKIPS